MSVRSATPDDAALLSRIAAATFPLACPPTTTRAAIEAFIAEHLSEASFTRYLADPARALFIAEVEGGAAGYAMLVFGEPSDRDAAAAVTRRPTAELSKLYLLPEHHGAGVARALVDGGVAAAASRGAGSVWLGVNQLNARANAFYQKSGFERVGTKRFLVGEVWEHDFVRERVLGERR